MGRGAIIVRLECKHTGFFTGLHVANADIADILDTVKLLDGTEM